MLPTQQPIEKDSLHRVHTGDALLVKSRSGWISRLIRLLSGSDFIHCAIAVRIDSHLYVVESKLSRTFSYQLAPVDWWIARHAHQDLFVGKMPRPDVGAQSMERRIRRIIMDAQESIRTYELSWLAAVYILQVWFGRVRPQFKRLFKGRRPMICSTLVQEAWERVGLIPKSNYMTPGDLVALMGGEQALIPIRISKLGDMHYPLPPASNDYNLGFSGVISISK